MESGSSALVAPTAGIVAAYVGAHTVSRDDIPALIATIHKALATVGEPEAETTRARVKPTADQIRGSITPDTLISFEDGRAYRTLKRHLAVRGLTITEYKAKWGLAADYPTTAATYSAMRSTLAKAVGLGKPGKARAPATKTQAAPEAAATATPARRGRNKKVVA